MAQSEDAADATSSEEIEALNKDPDAYFAVINESPNIWAGATLALVITHSDSDEDIFDTYEEAREARDRHGEQHGFDHLAIKVLRVSELPENALTEPEESEG